MYGNFRSSAGGEVAAAAFPVEARRNVNGAAEVVQPLFAADGDARPLVQANLQDYEPAPLALIERAQFALRPSVTRWPSARHLRRARLK